MYSNSRNGVPRVAQRYGTIAAHTRRRASVLVVFVVLCVHVYSFAGLIRRTPSPTFSDTAVTDRHSDTTIFQLRAHWLRISWSIGSEKNRSDMCPRWESNSRLPACKASTLSTRPGSPPPLEFWPLNHSVYSLFEKNSRIRNKQMFTNARAFSRVSFFLYFFCFSHMFCGKKVVVVFL